MLLFLRRHRQRFGRFVLGLFALAWMTVALQPCATAQERAAPAVHMDHALMDHGAMDHSVMDHAAAAEPCAPGADCPVFEAVDEQAAAKAAEPHDFPLEPAPALFASFPVPAFPKARVEFSPRAGLTPLPAPSILEFRVLLI